MKKRSGAKRTASPKISIERLKDMPLKEYTALLVRDMVAALNLKTRDAGSKRKEKQDRGKR
jgi:hypothetical protein